MDLKQPNVFTVAVSATVLLDQVTPVANASAAIGMVRRSGLDKLCHLNVRYLCLQDLLKNGKVSGAANPVDLATKHLA